MRLPGDSLWREVRALNLPQEDYAIVGSGPLAAHGLIASVRDVDMLARGEAWQLASSGTETQRGVFGDQIVKRNGGNIEIFDGLAHFDINGIIDTAVLIEGLPFANLEHVLAYKRFLRRPKDLQHIRLIEEYLSRRP